MTKTEKADAIAKALENVPVPVVQQVATATDLILGLIERSHGVDLTEEKSLLAAFAAAREPWQRIHDQATGVAPASALGVHTGSTGE